MSWGATTDARGEKEPMSDTDVIPLVDEGLGNTSYVVDLGDGLAVDVSGGAGVGGSGGARLRRDR